MIISLKLHNLTIIVRSVFEEDTKYYPHFLFIYFFWWMFAWVIKMLHSIKKISIENHPNYIFNDIINIKSFDPNL